MEVFCRGCGVSSDQGIVTIRPDFGDVLCQSCYERRIDEWAADSNLIVYSGGENTIETVS